MRKKIMVVDDEKSFITLLDMTLTQAGFYVMPAVTGKEALDKLNNSTDDFLPDLILLDINLPDMDGWSICDRLTRSDKFRHIPIIMLTVRNRKEDVVRGLNLGSDDYVTKPFDPDELVERINRVLSRSDKVKN